jgi:hypothetical protein
MVTVIIGLNKSFSSRGDIDEAWMHSGPCAGGPHRGPGCQW